MAADHADGVLATNSVGGLAAAEGLAGLGIKIGTFDLGPDVLKAVQRGGSASRSTSRPTCRAICRSRCWRCTRATGSCPSQHDIVATGPNFVTRSNAAQALELSERSIR